jgi:hypothetical protein
MRLIQDHLTPEVEEGDEEAEVAKTITTESEMSPTKSQRDQTPEVEKEEHTEVETEVEKEEEKEEDTEVEKEVETEMISQEVEDQSSMRTPGNGDTETKRDQSTKLRSFLKKKKLKNSQRISRRDQARMSSIERCVSSMKKQINTEQELKMPDTEENRFMMVERPRETMKLTNSSPETLMRLRKLELISVKRLID